MSYGIDRWVKPVETPHLHPVLNRSFTQAQGSKLRSSHDSVLAARKLGHPRVDWVLVIPKPSQRPYSGT